MKDYEQFLERKTPKSLAAGFAPSLPIHDKLFDWQQRIITWALRLGRSAIFADCGLGKTLMQLEWARHVAHHTNGLVLILAPLAVAQQTEAEGRKFGIAVKRVREPDEIGDAKIIVTNYDRAHKFEQVVTGIVLDESSVLKDQTAKTCEYLTRRFATTLYRLCCTATPAPNDYTEFGTTADFLGVCGHNEMLATYFVHDAAKTSEWRLKRHAVKDFWRWVTTWAMCVTKPSDIGGEDTGFILPDLAISTHAVDVDLSEDAGEDLFRMPSMSGVTMHAEMRKTATDRAAQAAALVAAHPGEPIVIWCNTNYEADALKTQLPEATEVRGCDPIDYKEACSDWFLGVICDCQFNTIISKLATCGSTNMRRYAVPDMPQTQNIESGANRKPGARPKTANTCSGTIKKTNTDGIKGLQKSKANTIKHEDRNTHPIQSCGRSSSYPQENSGTTIQKSDSHNDCDHSASRSSNTENYLPAKMEDAPSVASLNPSTEVNKLGTESGAYTSTTAIQQEKSEGCSAQGVISQSDNLMMIHPCLTGHQCICGGIKSDRVIISKPSILGFGVNYQHCCRQIFVGLSYSFEQFYQATRRSHRFGQKKPVTVHMIYAKTEGAVKLTLEKKMRSHEQMKSEMMEAAMEMQMAGKTKSKTMTTEIKSVSGDNWSLNHGDCVRAMNKMPDEAVDFSIYSPPFASLYTYSDDVQDLGNCGDMDEFIEQYTFVIRELYRLTKPGRLSAVHCCDLPLQKWKDGVIAFSDFSGLIISTHIKEAGWIMHSPRVTIWKDPVVEMQRTKALGLLHKQLKKDSIMSRVGNPDYLLVFRKPGENPEPVVHTAATYPVEQWQKDASPVWMDIDQGDVMDYAGARDQCDERHICPLQLGVIRRALRLWSNERDHVFSPFAGIGSEGATCIAMKRRFTGCELKRSYFDQACANLRRAEAESATLFD